jgi:predicted small lipoprotein YifL
MKAIFSKGVLLALLMLITGCGEREPAVITPSKEAAAVIEPFLQKLRAGDQKAAAAYVTSGASDELEAQFASDSKKLAATVKLTPRFTSLPTPKPTMQDTDNKTELVYAAKKGEQWTSANIRIAKQADNRYKIEYWRITNKEPVPPFMTGAEAKAIKQQQQIMTWVFVAMGGLGIAGLALLIWFVRRKPHLIAPEIAGDDRKRAATVGDL